LVEVPGGSVQHKQKSVAELLVRRLFQVNTWLTWLEEADTEDDEEEA